MMPTKADSSHGIHQDDFVTRGLEIVPKCIIIKVRLWPKMALDKIKFNNK